MNTRYRRSLSVNDTAEKIKQFAEEGCLTTLPLEHADDIVGVEALRAHVAESHRQLKFMGELGFALAVMNIVDSREESVVLTEVLGAFDLFKDSSNHLCPIHYPRCYGVPVLYLQQACSEAKVNADEVRKAVDDMHARRVLLRAGRFSGYRVQAVTPNFRLFNEVLSDRPVFHITPSDKLQKN